MRLDQYLAQNYPDSSRNVWKRRIEEGVVKVNDSIIQEPKFKIAEQDNVTFDLPEVKKTHMEAENIPLNIIYEDDDILVIDKPARLVVHPAPGHRQSTLANALLHHCGELNIGDVMRPGIVHRLDKDTSGVMVVGKTEKAFNSLTKQFEERKVEKEYLALVRGVPSPAVGEINKPIGRHPGDFEKMTSRKPQNAKEAITYYQVDQIFGSRNAVLKERYSLIRCQPKTGRTHQIRVHLSEIGYPIIGDKLYGGSVDLIRRQFLHACLLRFKHPITKEIVEFESPLPEDLERIINKLSS